MSSRSAFRISLIFALGIVGLSVYAATHAPLLPCNGRFPVVLAFELARSVTDLHRIFGDAPSACRDVLVAGVTRNTWGDSLIFIPVYGAFMVFFFLGIWRWQMPLARAGLALAVLALFADYVENACLFAILKNLDAPSVALALLPWATGVKWLALALAGVAGCFVLSTRGLAGVLAAALSVMGGALTALALIDPAHYGAQIANGIAVSWLLFLIADIRESIRRAV
jgi:hypothetical protein